MSPAHKKYMKQFEHQRDVAPPPEQTERLADVIPMRARLKEALTARSETAEPSGDTTELLNDRAALIKQQELLERDRVYEAAHEFQQVLQEAAAEQAKYEAVAARFQETESQGAVSKFLSSSFGERALLQQRMQAHKTKHASILKYAATLEPSARIAEEKRTALREITQQIAQIDEALERQNKSTSLRQSA